MKLTLPLCTLSIFLLNACLQSEVPVDNRRDVPQRAGSITVNPVLEEPPTPGSSSNAPVTSSSEETSSSSQAEVIPPECVVVQNNPPAPEAAPQYPNMTLEIYEDFSFTNRCLWEDTSVWTYGDGTWGPTGRDNLVRFNRNNVEFENGVMRLVIKDEFMRGGRSYSEGVLVINGREVTNVSQDLTHARIRPGIVQDKTFSSGELRTKGNAYRYGRYEMKMRAPGPDKATGYVLTMFTFHFPKQLDWKEIDIEVEGTFRDRYTTNLIWGAWPLEAPERAGQGTGFDKTNWNIYAFEWLPNKIRWFVNGRLIRETENSKRNMHGALINENAQVPTRPGRIHFNFWITSYGNTFGGVNTGNRYPLVGEYEWFRFYRHNSENKANFRFTDFPPE
jgi:endo-1,3-1,4-beta-glycanase ExoK